MSWSSDGGISASDFGEERDQGLVDGGRRGEVVECQGLVVELLEGDARAQAEGSTVERLQLEVGRGDVVEGVGLADPSLGVHLLSTGKGQGRW